jgi:hypothetical protein
MSSDRFHVDIGPPEDSPTPGAQYTFPQRTVRIEATTGFRDLELPQLDGVILALDWVANDRHHTWGSAVMVAPGIALTAGHVVDEMRERGFLASGVMQLRLRQIGRAASRSRTPSLRWLTQRTRCEVGHFFSGTRKYGPRGAGSRRFDEHQSPLGSRATSHVSTNSSNDGSNPAAVPHPVGCAARRATYSIPRPLSPGATAEMVGAERA